MPPSSGRDHLPGPAADAVIGVLGGSFNPPHVAHQLLALYALETTDLDEVWLVPTFRHRFGKELAPYPDRVAMCERADAGLGRRVRVCRAEEELARAPGFTVSRTHDLLVHLAGLHPGRRWRLLIGADILAEAHRWHRWDEVVTLAPPVVVGRAGAAPATVPGMAVRPIELPPISSTEIRRRLASGEDVSGLLPRAVIGYIAERGLYR